MYNYRDIGSPKFKESARELWVDFDRKESKPKSHSSRSSTKPFKYSAYKVQTQ